MIDDCWILADEIIQICILKDPGFCMMQSPGFFLVCLGVLVSVCVVQLWEAFLCSIFRSHYDFFADITEQTCFQDAGHGI